MKIYLTTEIKVKTDNKECPRCGQKAFGNKSETAMYGNGKLQTKYSMKKGYCRSCAYVDGDVIDPKTPEEKEEVG